ncbi:hypothetical protein FKM82_026074 [Ascaphus truei]
MLCNPFPAGGASLHNVHYRIFYWKGTPLISLQSGPGSSSRQRVKIFCCGSPRRDLGALSIPFRSVVTTRVGAGAGGGAVRRSTYPRFVFPRQTVPHCERGF